jgi:hypothetical protein
MASPLAAHTLADVEGSLADRERYFQPIDKPAPNFTSKTPTAKPSASPTCAAR